MATFAPLNQSIWLRDGPFVYRLGRKKRIRQTEVKNARNKYYHKTARNAVKALRNTTEKDAAVALLPKVTAMLDKLAKTNVIHKNKAANLKSSVQLHVNAL